MADVSYSIRIVNDQDRSVKGKKVSAHYSSSHDSDYTDDDGWVYFTAHSFLFPNGIHVHIYCGGEDLGKHYAKNSDTFSFTI